MTDAPWSAGLLGVVAHLGQESIVSQAVADGIRGFGKLVAEIAEPSLDRVRHVTLLRTRDVRQLT